MQERPEVTVRDPSRVPVALEGVDRPPRPQRAGVVAAVALAGAVTLALAVPLGQAVPGTPSLSLTGPYPFQATVGARVSSRSVLVSIDAELRNDGAEALTVGRASLGGYRSVSLVELAPGASEVIRLIRTVTCPAGGTEPAPDPPTDGLRVQLIAQEGARDLLLSPGDQPLERLRGSAQRACGFPPVEDAVDLMVFAAGTDSGGSRVTLLLTNASRRRVQLLEVRLAVGLRLVTPLRLPHALPGTGFGGTPAPARLDVTVVADCTAAPRSADGSLAALPADPVEVVVGEVPAGEGPVGELPAGEVPVGEVPGLRVGPLGPSTGYLTLLREAYTDACSSAASRAS